ncbi:cell wall metabolism sensor histidine kinase WalK [Petrotoga sp. 9PWA.NaAc.5.4]|uniref:sensor histidine kinase n=1 Tax=Petrotoga sp. 9PWA.NaAc.5.4 TaxID=1434328 RepID=UPI000CBBBCDD|nr:ATP-binding protein [Petrotoga sp. 9PWA.NaAc.5.4]PNR96853.1 hypothetical protein X924_02500 [Petrotoga sp. 9PWA.NaAc.5.4]
MNALYIGIIILLIIVVFFLYLRKKRLEKSYQNLKSELLKILNLNIKNPLDDFLLLQLNTYIKNLEEKYKFEKYRRRNVFSILDTLSEGVILVSFHQSDTIRIDFANLTAINIFTTEDFVGRSLTEVMDNHNLIDLAIKSFKSDEDMEEEIPFYYPEKRYFKCKIKSINIENYRVIILTDITKERNLEDLRKEFLTIMSHEMRTPLSIINGYLETILSEENLSEDIYILLKKIEEETSRLTRMFNDLLDIARMEKNIAEEKKFSSFNLSKTIKKAYDFFKIVAEKTKIEFNSEISDNIYIYGNEDRLLQAVYNLLDNAFKFTSLKEAGEKTVWLRLYRENEDVILEIEDTGIGIPSKELKKIFNMFYRVDKSRTRQVPGLGLGLYIVKTILEMHNARIILDSEENSGSLFRIIIPFRSQITNLNDERMVR